MMEGIDVIMLGRETSHSEDPIGAIDAVAQIVAESERVVDGKKRYRRIYENSNLTDKDELLAMLIAQ